MKVIAANRLTDGETVWLGAHESWVEAIDEALSFDDDLLEDAVAIAQASVARRLVVEPEPVDVTFEDGRTIPVRLRERIRAAGPTVRTDLGKQAAGSARP